MNIQDLIDAIAVKLKELYIALTVKRAMVGKAYEALTGKPIEVDESAQVAALTSDLKTSADDIEGSVAESQK